MQAKAAREKNTEFVSNNLIKTENLEKGEKVCPLPDLKVDATNGDVKKEIPKDDISPYEKKYYGLLQRCEIVKQSNERLVNRIYYVKKLLRRRKKERKFLMDRLDGYGDDYATVAQSLFSEMIGDSSPTRTALETKPDLPSMASAFPVQIKMEPES